MEKLFNLILSRKCPTKKIFVGKKYSKDENLRKQDRKHWVLSITAYLLSLKNYLPSISGKAKYNTGYQTI